MIPGKVLRQRSTPLGTPGRLTMDNGFVCDTQELAWHDNERGKSCTAPGVDKGKVWYSPTLKRLVIRFEDRNGRKDVLIHHGNFAADAQDLDGDGQQEVSDVHGCTETGLGFGEVMRKDGKMQWGIKNSGATLKGLIDSLRCDPAEADTVVEVDGVQQGFHDVEITYEWAEGAAP